MSGRERAILIATLGVLWILLNSVLRSSATTQARIFNDDYDRAAYAERGSWALLGRVPYRDVPSEYPQIATYLFGVPYLVTGRVTGNYRLYTLIFSALMLGALYATIALLHHMLPTRKSTAWLLLLPGPLYFSYNRFDIVPSLLVLISLFYLRRSKAILATVWLAIAAFTKWYPALLLPLYLRFARTTTGRTNWRMAGTFAVVSAIILVPTAVSGGIPALILPYAFHANRGAELVSLPALTQTVAGWLGIGLSAEELLRGFFVLSVLPAGLSCFVRIETYEDVIAWAVIVTGGFVLFSRIWSPQWVLWLLPLMLLAARTTADIVAIVVYGILSYVSFPLLFDLYPRSRQFGYVAAVVYLLILGTMGMAFWRWRAATDESPLGAAAGKTRG